MNRPIYPSDRVLTPRLQSRYGYDPPQLHTCVQCGHDDWHHCLNKSGEPCQWVMGDLCSNPRCLELDPRTKETVKDIGVQR